MRPYHDQYEPKSHHVQQRTALVSVLLAAAEYYLSVDTAHIRQWGIQEINGGKSYGRIVHSNRHFVE